ncbi:MAG: hypothetical protein NW220_17420 [Leptolyngbyaceae cyanobacterium bins.349]|nr:hypothetical protein [Leptolyngbyaceae cyanobacterium bins.349]
MKTTSTVLTSSTVAIVSLLSVVSNPANANCANSISYMVDKNGRCTDLTFLTQQSAFQRKVEAIEREMFPAKVYGLRMQKSDAGNWFLRGELVNTGSKPITVSSISVRFQRKRDGELETVSLDEFPIFRRVEPGQSIAIDELMTRYEVGDPVLQNVKGTKDS